MRQKKSYHQIYVFIASDTSRIEYKIGLEKKICLSVDYFNRKQIKNAYKDLHFYFFKNAEKIIIITNISYKCMLYLPTC